MTESFIHKTIPLRMRESGYGDNYRVEMRSFRVMAGSTERINADGLYIYVPADLIPATSPLEVESNFGLFAPLGSHNQQQFEHTGKIEVRNPGTSDLWFVIIAAIPQQTL